MKVLIEIDEEVYKWINEHKGVTDFKITEMLYNSVRNGTPLPKGHGRLIDVGQCNRKLFYHQCGGANSLITVKSAFDMLMSWSTIIEADAKK